MWEEMTNPMMASLSFFRMPPFPNSRADLGVKFLLVHMPAVAYFCPIIELYHIR